jgi:hypothetical protein
MTPNPAIRLAARPDSGTTRPDRDNALLLQPTVGQRRGERAPDEDAAPA